MQTQRRGIGSLVGYFTYITTEPLGGCSSPSHRHSILLSWTEECYRSWNLTFGFVMPWLMILGKSLKSLKLRFLMCNMRMATSWPGVICNKGDWNQALCEQEGILALP